MNYWGVMMKQKRKWYMLAGSVLIVLIVFITGKQWFQATTATEVMTNKEIQQVIKEKYPGKVLNTALENNIYNVDLERETGMYEIMVHATTGEILSLERVSQPTKTEQKPNVSKPANIAVTKPVKTLTEAEVYPIALKLIPGQLDGIELESVNGVSYYFVEIEANNGKEAEIQIHAITGEVMSVTWDD